MPSFLRVPVLILAFVPLHIFQHLLLEFLAHWLAGIVLIRLTVKTEKRAEIELGSLEELDLSYVYILEGIDALASLLNLTTNDLGNQLGGQLAERAAASLPLHNIRHLLPDGPDLRARGICSLLDLVLSLLGESDAEEAEEVLVGGLYDNVGFDEGLPLADEGAQLIGGEVEAVEVGEAVLALDLVDPELDLAERVVLVLLQIRQRNLEYPALQRIVRILETSCPVDESLADISDLEGGGSLDRVPVLLREWVSPLFKTLLAL